MAKDLSRYQQGIVNRYYEHQDTIRANRLSDMVAELWLVEDEKQATKLWGKAQVELMKAGCNAQQVANAVNKRDVEAVARLVQQVDAASAKPGGSRGKASSSSANEPTLEEMESPLPGEARGTTGHKGQPLPDGTPLVARNARSLADGRTIEQMRREKAAAGGYDSLEPENLRRAMNEFKKKLKSIRRDDESRLSGRYTTKGRTSAILAITPPKEFPLPVWEELVRQGRLRKAGQGTYQMP
jgi:hypothetical protein